MTTLRQRILFATLAGVSLTVLVAGLPVFFLVRERLISRVDTALTSDLRATVAPLLSQLRGSPAAFGEPPVGGPAGGPRPPGGPGLDHAPIDAALSYLCRSADGTVLLASGDLEERDVPSLTRASERRFLRDLNVAPFDFETVHLPDRVLRAAAVRIVPLPPPRPRPRGRDGEAGGGPPGPRGPGHRDRDADRNEGREPAEPVEVLVARDLGDVDEDMAFLAILLAGAWALSSLGAGLVVAFVVRRGLRPLDLLRGQIASVDEDRLDHRFALAGAPAELIPVVDQMNSLLQRMRTSLEREKVFGANTAHELRTPLAGLRATLEVAIAHAESEGEHREAEEKSLGIALEMQSLVETLLQLARPDQAAGLPRSSFPWSELTDASIEKYAELARDRRIVFESRVPPGLEVHAVRELLARVLDNLVENAASYADPGSSVTLEAHRQPEFDAFEISNLAAGAPQDLAERATDAFWRAESARSQTGRHAGLGLSLCRQAVDALQGRLTLERDGDRVTVRIELPR